MSTVLNRTTKELIASADTPQFPESEWIINPDLSAVQGYRPDFWCIEGDSVFLLPESMRDGVYSVKVSFYPSIPFIRESVGDIIPNIPLRDCRYDGVVLCFDALLSAVELRKVKKLVAISGGKVSGDWRKTGLYLIGDTLGMHDLSQEASWPAAGKSAWVLDPTNPKSELYGKSITINSLQLDIDEQLDILPGGEILVELYSNLIPRPLMTVVYSDIRDLISRSTRKARVEFKGSIGPFLQLNMDFTQPPTLLPSVGIGQNGIPKLNKLILRIADDKPLKKVGGETVCSIAKGRYFVELYHDLDF